MPDARNDLGWRRGMLVFAIALTFHITLLGLAALFRSPVVDDDSGATKTLTFEQFWDDPDPDPISEPQIAEAVEPAPMTSDFSDVPPEVTPPPVETTRQPVAAKTAPQPNSRSRGNPADAKSTSTAKGNANTGWSTPKPIYPFQARRLRLQGSGGIRVSTNSLGRVTTAEMQPGIAPLLDAAAVSHALLAWSGPPNRTRVVPIIFVLE